MTPVDALLATLIIWLCIGGLSYVAAAATLPKGELDNKPTAAKAALVIAWPVYIIGITRYYFWFVGQAIRFWRVRVILRGLARQVGGEDARRIREKADRLRPSLRPPHRLQTKRNSRD